MNRDQDSAQLNRTFAILEQTAAEGGRCPENGAHGIASDLLHALALAGRIRVEVTGRNYRVVTILKGDHAGKSTAPNPHRGANTWLVVDKNGTRRNGERVNRGASRRQQPSAPRPFDPSLLRGTR